MFASFLLLDYNLDTFSFHSHHFLYSPSYPSGYPPRYLPNYPPGYPPSYLMLPNLTNQFIKLSDGDHQCEWNSDLFLLKITLLDVLCILYRKYTIHSFITIIYTIHCVLQKTLLQNDWVVLPPCVLKYTTFEKNSMGICINQFCSLCKWFCFEDIFYRN